MRWQIAQYIFCDQQQTLSQGDAVQQLEPMVVELLSYFCQNTNQIISKDQLIEQVWLGRIVTDNAVSKLITKLRKSLADDVRKPQFIATFPKKGYKFIALVEPLAETEKFSKTDKSIPPSIPSGLPASLGEEYSFIESYRWYLISALVLLLIATFMIKHEATRVQPILTYAKALTSDAGDDLFPVVSPDGSFVAYMSAKNNKMHLMVKNLLDENIIEITHGDYGVGPAGWSDDGTMLAYLVATSESCQYYLRTIDGLQLGEAKLIHNCHGGSFGSISFTHDNNRLIFTENEGANTPYSLFEINVETGVKKRLNQPKLFLGGNSQFDLHPTENKLLISSPDKQQWEGFYSLDLETDELRLLFKQDAYICCGIWSHSGDRVILMGEYPAYQLISYDLTGGDMQIIFSGSRILSQPTRHSNGQDYLFISGWDNMDIGLIFLDNNTQKELINSSVDDRLPAFAHHNQQIAYVGLTTGAEEVWIIDTEQSQPRKLTQFNDSRHYLDLKWSPDGKLILALTLNEIHLIDTASGQSETLKIPQVEIRAVSFKDDNTISYSIELDNRWSVHQYQISNQVTKKMQAKWKYVQYSQDKDNTLWLDQDNKLYQGAAMNPIKAPLLLQQDFLFGRNFNLKKQGTDWFWYDHKKDHLNRYAGNSTAEEVLVNSKIGFYDLKDNRLIFGVAQDGNIDVYQTQRLD